MTTNEIRFYWNGIKVNGGDLIKVLYCMHDDGEIQIIANDYSHSIPQDCFTVVNNSDLYTDYFDDDHADVSQDHPLYRFVLYAWYKLQVHDLKNTVKTSKARAERRPRYADGYLRQAREAQEKLDSLDEVKNPGNPTAADLAKVEAMNQAAESARLAAQHEEELKAREEHLAERNGGNAIIHQAMEANPIVDGQPVVTINWSEHPAFYEWEDGALKLSLAAAEIILKALDKDIASKECRGYDKTSFRIDWINENGESDSYEGRYDLGDDDGGLIAHIRSFGQYQINHVGEWGCDPDAGREIVALADMLESFTGAVKVVKVEILPEFQQTVEARKKAASDDIFDMVSMLTDEQLEEAIMMIPYEDKSKHDTVRFFLQELCSRDRQKALKALRKWNGGRFF